MNAVPDKALRQSLRADGFKVQPIKTRPGYIRGYALSPDIVFDIGVGNGTSWLYRSFPDARFVLIDPQEQSAQKVRENGYLQEFHFHSVALGDEEGQAELFVPCGEQGRRTNLASLNVRVDHLATAFEHKDVVDVSVKPLDNIALAYPGRVGLKIAVSGAEQDVLDGAKETLKRAEFVILIVSVSRRFDRLSLPSQAIASLAKAGLELRDVISVGAGAGKKAQPRYLEVLFTRWAVQ